MSRDFVFEAYRRLEQCGLPRSYLGVIVEHVLGVRVESLLVDDSFDLTGVESLLNDVLRCDVPLAYLVGYEEFMGQKIRVNSDVLIPRVESEFVVLETFKRLAEFDRPLRVLDLCTGSGCLLIGLAQLCVDYDVEWCASDLSAAALAVARGNFVEHGIDVTVYEGDLLSAVRGDFDVIISNPPYLPEDMLLDRLVVDNEPLSALFAPDNGLALYKRVIDDVASYLRPGGVLCFEIGHDQGAILSEYASKFDVGFSRDLFGNDRFLWIKGL